MKTTDCVSGKLSLALMITITVASTSLLAQALNMAITSSGEIISGGPSREEAKTALVERISQQSEGKIALLNFQPTKTKLANVDLKEKSYCEFSGLSCESISAFSCTSCFGRVHSHPDHARNSIDKLDRD